MTSREMEKYDIQESKDQLKNRKDRGLTEPALDRQIGIRLVED